MALNKDNVERIVNFRWTDEYEKIFCELCIKFIRKNGRVSFKWKEINQEFETMVNRKCTYKSLKNKYDTMRKDWRIWRFLKFGESGLGYNSTIRKLSCSKEWWDRKIKEKPEVKKFRNKSIDPSLEEYWNQLFEDNYANGENVVAHSANPNFLQPSERVNVEEEDKESGGEDNHQYESDGEHVYSEYNRYAPRVENLLHEENFFWPDFINEVGGNQHNQGSTFVELSSQSPEGTQVANQGDDPKRNTQTQNVTNKLIKGKRKRRQFWGATKLGDQIDTMISQSTKVFELMQASNNVSKCYNPNSTIAAAMTIVNRMVNASVLEKSSDLWCFAASLIENEARREIFLNMEDDDSRKAWLTYMHTKEKKGCFVKLF